MSLIETTIQKPKEYSEKTIRKQDHGDAAEQRDIASRRWYVEPYDLRGRKIAEDEHLHDALAEAQAYDDMTPEQLEAEADTLLAEAPEDGVDDTYTIPDTFPTEAEFGLKSKHEIGREMARRVTLDVSYDEDDNGDSDYTVPVHIKNRL